MHCLEFEKPIIELDEKIAELQRVSKERNLDLSLEIKQLQGHSNVLTEEIFAKLSAWEITQIARHSLRPYTLDYIERIVTNFQELHGDRMYADDPAIVTGLGKIAEHRVAVIGHQKGRDTHARTQRNFGMPRPEGYRKSQRVMQLAERFRLPVITLIDTPGAYPGIGAEERGQSAAIASSLQLMTTLKTPIISVVIGEGGSGGALAIGVCDKLLILQYAIYSVISPEGCAAILWKNAEKAAVAAEAMKITTADLANTGIVDEVIAEPLGGAHRNYDAVAESVKSALIRYLDELSTANTSSLLAARYKRLTGFGEFKLVQ